MALLVISLHLLTGLGRVAVPSQTTAPADPPPTSQPSATTTLMDSDDTPVAQVRIDPRGLSSIRLAADPPVEWVIPRRDHAWDYREWQWWKGHPWGEEMRPRFYANPSIDLKRLRDGYARIDYLADGFRGVQQFFLPRRADRDLVTYDVVTTITNETGGDVSEYGQFFACYTPVNHRASSLFWDADGGLVTWEDRGVGHLDGYVTSPDSWIRDEGRIPHCPRGDGKVVGTWRHPVLVSHASPTGWRTVLLVEESGCAAVTQGMEGNAMDYILYPGHTSRRFINGEQFSVHVRHCFLRSPAPPDRERLDTLWKTFEESHKAVHRKASGLR